MPRSNGSFAIRLSAATLVRRSVAVVVVTAAVLAGCSKDSSGDSGAAPTTVAASPANAEAERLQKLQACGSSCQNGGQWTPEGYDQWKNPPLKRGSPAWMSCVQTCTASKCQGSKC